MFALIRTIHTLLYEPQRTKSSVLRPQDQILMMAGVTDVEGVGSITSAAAMLMGKLLPLPLLPPVVHLPVKSMERESQRKNPKRIIRHQSLYSICLSVSLALLLLLLLLSNYLFWLNPRSFLRTTHQAWWRLFASVPAGQGSDSDLWSSFWWTRGRWEAAFTNQSSCGESSRSLGEELLSILSHKSVVCRSLLQLRPVYFVSLFSSRYLSLPYDFSVVSFFVSLFRPRILAVSLSLCLFSCLSVISMRVSRAGAVCLCVCLSVKGFVCLLLKYSAVFHCSFFHIMSTMLHFIVSAVSLPHSMHMPRSNTELWLQIWRCRRLHALSERWR